MKPFKPDEFAGRARSKLRRSNNTNGSHAHRRAPSVETLTA
jgi:DNA-binding response OmpR family regulator